MSNKKKNILIYLIDDSQLVRYLASVIERNNDHVKIKTFKDAESSIVACNLNVPDLIFLDYYLDYMDDDFDNNGDVVLYYVKEYLPQIKVVLLTNLTDKAKINELLRVGFDGFIHKGEGNFLKNMTSCISRFTDTDYIDFLNASS